MTDADGAGGVAHAEIVEAIFQGILERPIAAEELPRYVEALRTGTPLSQMIGDVARSEEFRARSGVPAIVLPDLTALHPERYARRDDGDTIFLGRSDDDVRFLETMIAEHRYYDSFGVWAPEMNIDKRLTAAIIAGLDAKSALELGCFNGMVLGLLKRRGIEVTGVELSHLAFLLADPEIYPDMRFGTLETQALDRTFDVFYGMDVLEHISPLRLDSVVGRIARLIRPDGYVYINSPMFGADDIFGTVFPTYVPEWDRVGDAHFWYQMHCDPRGWPMHGHLVWASPAWWEHLFARHGLERDRVAERIVHRFYDGFIGPAAARRTIFALRHAGAPAADHAAIERRLHAEASALNGSADPGG